MKKLLSLTIVLFGCMANAQTPLLGKVDGADVGDTIALFSAMDQDSTRYSVHTDLSNGPIVLIFIRGQWCPYCNRHTRSIQDSLALLKSAGAKVVVVSPQKPEFIAKTIKKTNLETTILYDSGYVIMNQFDVLFTPSEKTMAKYKLFLGDGLIVSQSDDTQRLPVPATYTIGQDGVIKWRHFDRNYSKRSTISDILKNLK
tara:strand:+ start:2231 stop:2830 length:600 start_codon:yes stop_codon:yes gene_type:complete